MNSKSRRVLALVLLISLGHVASSCAPAVSDPFDYGIASAKRGDYVTALQIFKPLADRGHPGAQGVLGRMYATGEGVPQDYVQAYKWFTLSATTQLAWAANVRNASVSGREFVAAKMTTAQIAEAQKLASEWRPS